MATMRPMLATPGTHVPAGDEWVHEVKWDGIRLLADVAKGRTTAQLTTRNENVATVAWPEVAAPGTGSGRDLLVDGEVIALNDAGLPDFRALADRMHVRDARRAARFAESRPATYMVFDVLRLDGRMLLDLPWTERRAILEGLAAQDLMGGAWQVPATYDDGAMLHEVTREQGLEGIVSKRRSSRYRPGERSREWLKFPHRFRGSYVVGGWRPQVGTSDRLAALLVGQPTPAGLVYRGRVGSGIGASESRQLRALLAEAPSSPFLGPADDPAGGVPREDAVGTRWTRPLLVVDVETHGRHTAVPNQVGRLRQPAFIGTRPDLGPEDLL